jgi:hypothetical protein
MMRLKDLTGARFGKLTVIERAPSRKGHTFWKCKCDCGNTKIVESYDLQHGKYFSCGCEKRPNPRKINMIGRRFGTLTVISEAPNPYKRKPIAWLCKCECGKTIVVEGGLLRRGYYSSCGCQRIELLRKAMTKHGLTDTKLYHSWKCMKYRCLNSHYTEYHLYGGRGITVCNEWLTFENFAKWALANGYKEGLSIDRIDANGNYERNNCKWSTAKEQANNKRNNHFITCEGETHTLAEWADIKGLDYGCLESRLNNLGWDIKTALNRPSRGRGKRKLLKGTS